MTGSHFWLPVILHYLLVPHYGVVVGSVGTMGAGAEVVSGNGRMN